MLIKFKYQEVILALHNCFTVVSVIKIVLQLPMYLVILTLQKCFSVVFEKWHPACIVIDMDPLICVILPFQNWHFSSSYKFLEQQNVNIPSLLTITININDINIDNKTPLNVCFCEIIIKITLKGTKWRGNIHKETF